MMDFMGLWMLLGLLVVAAVLGVAVYLAVRGGLGSRERDDDAQALLERRFAAGEIDADEYHERAATLRSLRPGGRRR